MMKNRMNLIFFVIIITIFLFFLFSTEIHGFRTPKPENNRLFVSPNQFQPVYISPSNVRVISQTPILVTKKPEIQIPQKSGFFVGKNSPTESIVASTIFNIPIEYPKEPLVYRKFNEACPKKMKESVGERLCHKIFKEFVESKLGKKKEIMRNIRPHFLKNPKTGCNLELDMFEAFDDNIKDKNSIKDGIAIEYNGLQHDEFVPTFHKNHDAFLDQRFRDEHKMKICKEKGIILIVVDTKIDISRVPTKRGRRFINLSEQEREDNIREYLWSKLEFAYQELLEKRNKYSSSDRMIF